MPDNFLSLLGSIPATFWGVVIGSFFTIGGVHLTNRTNDRRLRAQFDHEQKTKTKEREMAMRKEIYLAAAETVTAGLSTLGRIPNLELTHEQATVPYGDRFTAISNGICNCRCRNNQGIHAFYWRTCCRICKASRSQS